jgi:DNA/RNA endonuclease YhcR with UshA esterase domain
VINKSRDSEATADRVIAKTLPVSLETVQQLTNQIKAIEVDSSLINKTYDGAAKGLKQAQQVERLSERAM